MDIIVKKQIGYLIAGIWGAWGLAILATLLGFFVHPLWIMTIELTWYAIDAFVIFFIHYYFNIEIRTPEEQLRYLLEQVNDVLPLVDIATVEKIKTELAEAKSKQT